MKASSNLVVALALMVLLTPSGAAAQHYPDSVRAYWGDYFERSLGAAPAGYAFAIREGEETLDGAEGFQRLPRDGRASVAMTPDSVVHLASISKTITALALLHLLSERQIDLDAPFWPHLRQAFAQLSPGARVDEISFAHVLAHRSGLPSLEIDAPVMDNLARQLGAATLSAPGQDFVYSNLNYTIARVLIEVISGERYEDYVRRVVLAPAGAAQMSLRAAPGLSFVHRVGDEESAAFDRDFTEDAGGYGWFGSSRDVAAIFARFAAGLYLTPEMRARMLRDRLGVYAFSLANGTAYSSDGHWNLADGRGSKTAVVVFPQGVVVALVMNTVWDGNLVAILTDGYRQNAPTLLAVEPVRTPRQFVRVTMPWHAREVRCAWGGEALGAQSHLYRAPVTLEQGGELHCAGFRDGRRVTHIARLGRS